MIHQQKKLYLPATVLGLREMSKKLWRVETPLVTLVHICNPKAQQRQNKNLKSKVEDADRWSRRRGVVNQELTHAQARSTERRIVSAKHSSQMQSMTRSKSSGESLSLSLSLSGRNFKAAKAREGEAPVFIWGGLGAGSAA
mmetsp:Transcript_39561/g.79311  ORF Transcript_39561/g.79311 Transcript_39561/m.79311 type:complete len:141 (-) Transcript_39561:21-443(-)